MEVEAVACIQDTRCPLRTALYLFFLIKSADQMRNKRDLAWSVLGILTVLFSCWLLYREVRGISYQEIASGLTAVHSIQWLLAVCATFGAYSALAWYDRIALAHLGKKVSWQFSTLCSFTAYALAHNIGASLISGGLIRYRAYRTQHLSLQEIGILIVFCSFTFVLGTILAGSFTLLIKPDLIDRVISAPTWLGSLLGLFLLALVGLYVLGAWKQRKPWKFGSFRIEYPRLPVVRRQLLAAPLELFCAAAIIYYVLPEAHNPGYVTILGIFLASFSSALLSHAPGGLGVLEVTFLAALPELPKVDVLVALIAFRTFYFLIPFVLALMIASIFEAQQWRRRQADATTAK